MSEDRQPYRFHHPVDVRFKDIDGGGHAHHSHALAYFEEARAAYWRDVVGRTSDDAIDYILAEVTLRWHQRVLWPARLDVSIRVSLVGRKHFVMDYRIDSPSRVCLVSGSTMQVMYDYAAAASKRLARPHRRVRRPVQPGRALGGGGVTEKLHQGTFGTAAILGGQDTRFDRRWPWLYVDRFVIYAPLDPKTFRRCS